jgi:hypothetical protein
MQSFASGEAKVRTGRFMVSSRVRSPHTRPQIWSFHFPAFSCFEGQPTNSFNMNAMTRRLLLLALLCGCVAPTWSAETNLTLVELNKLPFFLGREYFIQRSGRARMILQADRADLGPAFTYLLFDMQNARQSVRKDGACNFDTNRGFASSALEVELGGFGFTALGHRTEARWVVEDGIPAV